MPKPEESYESTNYVDLVKGIYSARDRPEPDEYDIRQAENDYERQLYGDA